MALYQELLAGAGEAQDRMIGLGLRGGAEGAEIRKRDLAPLEEWIIWLGRRLQAWEAVAASEEGQAVPMVHRAWEPPMSLTPREATVLVEIRAGRTNREIAYRLGISTPTVNKHVHQILRKLNARNRAHAATM